MSALSPLQQLFATVLALLGPAPADAPKNLQLKPGDKIVAMGDSITQDGGYLRDIDAVLAAEYPQLKLPKVINKGVSGQHAEDLVARFDRDVVQLHPAFVTISIGINDVWHRLGALHDPRILAAYKKNVSAMVDQAQCRHQGHPARAHGDHGGRQQPRQPAAEDVRRGRKADCRGKEMPVRRSARLLSQGPAAKAGRAQERLAHAATASTCIRWATP